MYTITIEQTRNVRKLVGKKWEPIERNGDHTSYGYAPEVETVATETTEIYKQTVEELNVTAIIQAVINDVMGLENPMLASS